MDFCVNYDLINFVFMLDIREEMTNFVNFLPVINNFNDLFPLF